jgi:Tol biopolymer transport system component
MNVVKVTHFGLAYAVVTDGVRLYIEQEQGAHHTLVTAPADGSSDPIPLPTPFANTSLFDISPDGRELLIASYDAAGDAPALWRLPLAGGSPIRVGDIYASSAKWSPDGKWIAFSGHSAEQRDALYLTDNEGAESRPIADSAGQVDSWSTNAEWVRFTQINQSTGGMKMWEAATSGAVEMHPLMPERENNEARWGEGQCCGLPMGKYFLFREGQENGVALWAVSDRPWFRKPQASELYPAGFDIDGHAPPALGSNGRRVYFVGRTQSQELMRLDKKKNQFVPYLAGLAAKSFGWAPDGRSLAYIGGPDMLLWRSNGDGSQRLQLTYIPMQSFEPRWSPDGKHLIFHTLSPGQPGKVAIISAEGGKAEVLAADKSSAEDSQSWSPDGNTVMFSRAFFNSAGTLQSQSIWTLDLKTHQESKLPGSDDLVSPKWSPDGRYAVAQTDDGHEIVLFDFRTKKWKRLAWGTSLQPPHWSHDSSAVYYQDWRVSEEQPIYRVIVATGKVQIVAGRKQILSSDVARYKFIGLTPKDEPVARVIYNNADIYRLDLELR